VGEYRLAVDQQHSRFLLDQRPIRWQDDVWLSWHADDGYMLERYREADERMIEPVDAPPGAGGDGMAEGR
jgi:spermidine/putrescine transport system ATP-binding protein